MIIVSDLTREIALELFDYDQVAGKLYWKAELPEKYFPSDAIRRMVQTKVGGKEAANVNKKTKYLQVVFQKKLYQVHRVIWLIENGKWPDDHIDHKNRSRQKNNIKNLRDVSQAKNNLNRSDNTTGHPNVFFRKNRPKKPWLVQITGKGKTLPQKTFSTLNEAIKHRDHLRMVYGLPPV